MAWLEWLAPTCLNNRTAPAGWAGAVALSYQEAALLFAFDVYGSRDVFGGQLTKLHLRVSVGDGVSVPQALAGLISQID
jgi:hypothetical protein